ncbi:MAG: GGDEF domain-containing protein [Planctomycetota bacterium]|nr:GGDEF domain-containing protein [Planctomycetota bacterium]
MDLSRALASNFDKSAMSESRKSPPPFSRRDWITRAGAVLVVAGVITSTNLLFRSVQLDSIQIPRLGLSITISMLVYLFISGMIRRWIQPAKNLGVLLAEIRAGDAPIEELSTIGGALRAVAEESSSILRELRQCKQQIAQLDLEIRQKIANRTDALERLVGSLRHQANRDPLTGLYNRRMLDQLMPQLVRQCVADPGALALLMIDVDYFKDLNDVLGHAAGDEMLRALGQVIRSTVRSTDFAFRFGGDEFVILMPGCEAPAAEKIAQRLESLVDAMASTYQLPRRPKLSIGVCTLADVADPTPESLINRADALLYEKKQVRKEVSRRESSDPAHATL